MKKICKSYKFRMYPDIDTIKKLNQFFDIKRFIYNYYLSKKDDVLEKEKRNYTLKEMQDDVIKLQKINPWLKDTDAFIIKNTLEDLDRTYKKYLKTNVNHPKYKCKNYKQTYKTIHIKNSYNNTYNIKVDLLNHKIKLPKLNPIEIKGYKSLTNFDKEIINAVISKEANRFYVSINVLEKNESLNRPLHNIVGIDIGIKNIITTSDGIKYNKMPSMQKHYKKLRKLSNDLSKKQKGSVNSFKNIIKIERVYQKIKNTRKYYIHSIVNDILKDNDIIITETLKTKGMIKKASKSLRKNIINTSFYEILKCINYKTEWQGKKHINICSYYPSSQICNHCNYKNNIDLSVRKFICKNCESYLDRDINASVNILWEGINKLYN